MALHILRQVSKDIRDSSCYTIMADKCTDVVNKEQFTICIRWVGQDLQDHKDFIGLYEVSSINADCLTEAIKDTLLQIGVKISDCRGQCYDGASNMSGIKNGVATQIYSQGGEAWSVGLCDNGNSLITIMQSSITIITIMTYIYKLCQNIILFNCMS